MSNNDLKDLAVLKEQADLHECSNPEIENEIRSLETKFENQNE